MLISSTKTMRIIWLSVVNVGCFPRANYNIDLNVVEQQPNC
jgi:hypothetical protein